MEAFGVGPWAAVGVESCGDLSRRRSKARVDMSMGEIGSLDVAQERRGLLFYLAKLARDIGHGAGV